MKSVESRIERLEATSGSGLPRAVIVVSGVSGLDSNGNSIAPGELAGLGIYGGELVDRIPGESREALIARATAIAEPLRGPRCAILLVEKYAEEGN